MIAIALSGTSPINIQAQQNHALEIDSVHDLGVIGKPPHVSVRDGGTSALIGGKLLWTFGDTLFSPKSVDGVNLRSSTAALADPATPLNVTEPLDANGAPSAFLLLTPEDGAADKPDDRLALWPGSLIDDGQNGAFVLYQALHVKPGILNYEFIGVGLAEVAAGQTTAVRDPGFLFTPPEPNFTNAALIDDQVYFYGNLNDGSKTQAVAVARVGRTDIRNRFAYQFWNGTDWVAESSAVQPVMTGIPGRVSVSYNAYLGCYLAVYSQVLSNKILMRTAPHPEGPWSDPVEAFTGAQPAKDTVDYAAGEHPELASHGGQTVVISYFNPQGTFTGDLHLVSVTFK